MRLRVGKSPARGAMSQVVDTTALGYVANIADQRSRP